MNIDYLGSLRMANALGRLRPKSLERLHSFGVSQDTYFGFLDAILFSRQYSKVLRDGTIRRAGRPGGRARITHIEVTKSLVGDYWIQQVALPNPPYVVVRILPDDPWDAAWDGRLSQEERCREITQLLGAPGAVFSELLQKTQADGPRCMDLYYFFGSPISSGAALRHAEEVLVGNPLLEQFNSMRSCQSPGLARADPITYPDRFETYYEVRDWKTGRIKRVESADGASLYGAIVRSKAGGTGGHVLYKEYEPLGEVAQIEMKLARAGLAPPKGRIEVLPQKDKGIDLPFSRGSVLLDSETLKPIKTTSAEAMKHFVEERRSGASSEKSLPPSASLSSPACEAKPPKQPEYKKYAPPVSVGIPLSFVLAILKNPLFSKSGKSPTGVSIRQRDFMRENQCFTAWRLLEWFFCNEGMIHSDFIERIPGFRGKSIAFKLERLEELGIRRRSKGSWGTRVACRYESIVGVYPEMPASIEPQFSSLEEGIRHLLPADEITKRYPRRRAERILKRGKQKRGS